MLRKWEELPNFMKCNEVREYYNILQKRKINLLLKRMFDLMVGTIMVITLAIPMVIIAVWIKIDSKGPVFYRQERITTYGKHFKIHKFRTMVVNADKIGTVVTVGGDSRITKVGAKLRDYRLDEFPQVFDVISGNMSFVGTRPETMKYVEKYKKEYCCFWRELPQKQVLDIRMKQNCLMRQMMWTEYRVYVEKALPGKMKYNLESIRKFSFIGEIATMFRTVFAVFGKEYK